jgi:DNA-binding transcriptional ArsR family regulator
VAKSPLQPSRCAQLLKALAEPERLRIIDLLRNGPRTVGEIAEELRSEFVNVSHHLNVLRHAGLVKSSKKGRFVITSLAPGLLQTSAGDADFLNLGCCRLELPDTPRPKTGSAAVGQ